MKQSACIIIILALLAAACKKTDIPPTTGTQTITNLRYEEHSTYALHGFTFSTGKEVSTENVPGPDIIIDTLDSHTLIFEANNLKPSFSKVADYPSESAAKDAYNNLKTADPAQWIDFSTAVLPNQVWIYRSGTNTYTKIRTISTLIEKRQNIGRTINYGECTFEWQYQPDGTLNFP
ncbi:MAG TPA: hypothetical protein VK155_06460 [Bacteroidales bacterium]|jgi:hypothetical protein|nr:hypothetical protein [Bacteroidales bacterium]